MRGRVNPDGAARTDGGAAIAGEAGDAADSPAVRRVRGLVTALGAALLLVLAFSGIADVLLRALAGTSLAGIVEWSEVGLVALAFVSIAAGQLRHDHVSADVVTDRLSPRAAAVLHGSGALLVGGILIWTVWSSAEVAWSSYVDQEVRFGLIRVPLWPGRLAIVMGLTVALGALAWQAMALLRSDLTRKTSVEDRNTGDSA